MCPLGTERLSPVKAIPPLDDGSMVAVGIGVADVRRRLARLEGWTSPAEP
jgi:hypothetical protein